VDATFPLVRLADVAAAAGGSVRGDPDLLVRDAAYDSRSVPDGALFFCVPGGTVDGHSFAADAAAAGAVALVVEHPVQVPVPQIVVGSVRRAMGPMAAVLFGEPGRAMTLVGVTGTNGKTTSTFLLEGVFRAVGLTPGVLGTIGSRIDGVPGPLARTTPEAPDLHRLLARMRDNGVQAVALEMSSHALAQSRVDGVTVDVAMFTNLSQDHLDFHSTMEAYFEAKAMLFTPLRARHGVVNGGDPWGRRLIEERTIPMTSYALDAVAELQARDLVVEAAGIGFTIEGVRVRSPLRGRFNAANCLGVYAVSRVLGFEPAAIAAGIGSVRTVPGRMEPVEAGQQFSVVVDYAHTPDSIVGVLRGARETAEGRVIVVFGCGGDRDRSKRPMMGAAAAANADLTIVTSDNPRSEDPAAIIDDIVRGIPAGVAFEVEPDRRRAIAAAVTAARPGDVVLIAGKGHESTQELADAVIPFDDRAVAADAIAAVAR
jgi:UDP-N-acetylmuramoyl-L-alanyl-D-glutamate--2,6-diaminopimelate ligase